MRAVERNPEKDQAAYPRKDKMGSYQKPNSRRVIFSMTRIMALTSAWLVGCATIASIPRELGRSPAEDERRIIDTFTPRVIAAARQEGFTCAEVPFVMI